MIRRVHLSRRAALPAGRFDATVSKYRVTLVYRGDPCFQYPCRGCTLVLNGVIALGGMTMAWIAIGSRAPVHRRTLSWSTAVRVAACVREGGSDHGSAPERAYPVIRSVEHLCKAITVPKIENCQGRCLEIDPAGEDLLGDRRV